VSKADYYRFSAYPRRERTGVEERLPQQALKYHPDRNPATTRRGEVKEASEAYQVLSDADKRAGTTGTAMPVLADRASAQVL